jgi:peptidyl-prolyl cis-trans isomerase C
METDMSSSPRGFLALLIVTLALPVAIAFGFGGTGVGVATDAASPSAGSGEAASELVITEQLLAIYSAQRLPQGRDATEEQIVMLRDELANIMSVAALANERGYAERSDLRSMILLDRVRTLASGYMQEEIGERPITDEELQARYEQSREANGIELQASHILVDDELTGQQLIQQLDEGADFAELARANSTGPSGPNGGDLGWFAPDAMVAPFSEATQALADGGYSPAPVQTQFGWHVILRTGSREVPAASFEEMEGQLRQEIERARFETLIDEARAAYPITDA